MYHLTVRFFSAALLLGAFLWHFFQYLSADFNTVDRIWPGLREFGPPMWQAEADTALTLSALPATAVGQSTLTLAN